MVEDIDDVGTQLGADPLCDGGVFNHSQVHGGVAGIVVLTAVGELEMPRNAFKCLPFFLSPRVGCSSSSWKIWGHLVCAIQHKHSQSYFVRLGGSFSRWLPDCAVHRQTYDRLP